MVSGPHEALLRGTRAALAESGPRLGTGREGLLAVEVTALRGGWLGAAAPEAARTRASRGVARNGMHRRLIIARNDRAFSVADFSSTCW